MAREANFNFVQEKHLTDTRKWAKQQKQTVTINAKHGYMRFSMSYIRDKGLENCFIKLYADTSKKAIGWKILREKDFADMKEYRQLKVYRVKTETGVATHCQLSVQKLLDILKVDKTKKYKDLPIQTYQLGPMDGSLSYVELQ